MNYYHYTKSMHLGSIVRGGEIRQSQIRTEKQEKPSVWLTTSSEWESACNVGIVSPEIMKSSKIYGTIKPDQIVTATDDYMIKEIGQCRIVLKENLPVVTWAKYKYVSGISEKMYDQMHSFNTNKGFNVADWRCTFNTIPEKYWVGVEMFVKGEWVRWDEKISIEEFVKNCMAKNNDELDTKDIAPSSGFQSYVYKQMDFIEQYKQKIIEFWEANKTRNGYVEIFVTPDYQPYKCGFRFIEKKNKKADFKPLVTDNKKNKALVHFLWQATFTQYKTAIGY
jgi:hypothetical protein